MPAIKPSSIRELKERINIFDVVSREVTLKKAGSEYKGLSPFNSEKTPSFYVSPDKGFYKCFSSGNAGDAISFVMETERLNFAEAVEALAKRFGFELEYEKGSAFAREDRSLRQELFELHESAADFYREQFLAANEAGQWIRDYWTQGRRFSLEVAEDFKIGYAPVDSVDLGRLAQKKGFSREAIEKCGLFYANRSTEPQRMGYRFRGRLMIPIRDHQGRIVAFTARQLELTPQDDPSRDAKYVNSPETPIFHKGSLLFNLDRARLKASEQQPFVMVEGQLDAIRCWSVGLQTPVAPQGTGITEAQLRLLKRYATELIVLLDGDSAGQKAALRMLPLALAQGMETLFVPLSDKEDPDDIFREGGKRALERLLERQLGPVPYACRAIAPEPAKLSPQAKAKAARDLFALIRHADSESVKVEFVRQAAEELQLDPQATQTDFQRFARSQSQTLRAARAKRENADAPHGEPKLAKPVYSVERDLLALCFSDAGIGQRLSQLVDAQWVDTSLTEGKVLNAVLNRFLHDMWEGPEMLNEELESDEQRKIASAIYFDAKAPEDPQRLCNEAIRKLVAKFADKKTQELKLEISRKESSNDPSATSLLGQITTLNQLRHNPPRLVDPFP